MCRLWNRNVDALCVLGTSRSHHLSGDLRARVGGVCLGKFG